MEILNTYTELNDAGVFILLVSIVVIVIGFFIGFCYFDGKKYKQGLITLLIAVSLLMSLILNFSKLPNNTYHDVIIENFSEVEYSKYEIVSSKGKIITIKEVK